MAKSFFTPRTPITANFLNAINNPRFVEDPEVDGDLPLIADTDLSNETGQIKQVAYDFIDGFRITEVTGLVVKVFAARRQLANGSYSNSQVFTFNLPASDSGEIWLNWLTGVLTLQSSSSTNRKPSSCYTIITWTTSATQVTSIQNVFNRARYQDVPSAQMLSLFGGRSQQDAVWDVDSESGADMVRSDGRYSFNNLTINITNPAKRLLFTADTTIQLAGDLVINGSLTTPSIIEVQPTSAGIGAVASNGNLLPILYNPVSGETVSSPSVNSWVSGRGRPGSSAAGLIANYQLVFPGGGSGGGTLRFQVAGRIIVNRNVTFRANGGVPSNDFLSTGSPNGTQPQLAVFSGASAGSGGLIHLQSGTSLEYYGSVIAQAQGAQGGFAFTVATGTFFTNGAMGLGGCGGGGGWIVEEAPAFIGVLATSTSPGIRGSDSGQYNGATTSFVGNTLGGGFGGRGGYYFIQAITGPQPDSFELPYPGLGWWYARAQSGQSLRLTRFPLFN